MSWQAYEVLTLIPDLAQEPVLGIGQLNRIDQTIGMRPGFAEWTGTTSKAFRFRYRTISPADHKAAREILNRIKGRWGAFYTPSWQPDMELAGTVPNNGTKMRIKPGAGITDLTRALPDTEKRVIFALTADLTLQTFFVTEAIEMANGDSVITVDKPSAQRLTLGEAMLGFCHLVRLADDRNTWEMDAPGRGSIELRMVSVRNHRTIEAVESVTSEAIEDMKAWEDLVATDEDPELTNFQEPTCDGPVTYDTPQGANYASPWEATFISGPDVQMEQTDSAATTTSALYDETGNSNHLTFAFDPVGREILCWTRDRTTCRARWYESGVAQSLDFSGYSPVAFNTWVVDGASAAGDAETAIFYLKPGYSAIFCRLFVDSFATEYEMLQSPAPPLYLHKAERVGSSIEIVGMDATHRKVRWRSKAYVAPIVDQATATLTIDGGSYDQIVYSTEPLADSVDSELIEITGAYVSRIITAPLETDQGEAQVASIQGAYVNRQIPTGPLSDQLPVSLVLASGSFTLVAKRGTDSDQGEATITEITGSYEQP